MDNTLKIIRALGDDIRLRIINILSCCDLYVCEMVEILELPQSTISRHLAILKEASVVDCQKKGSWISYSLVNNEAYELFVEKLMAYAVSKEEIYINDINRTSNRLKRNRGCPECKCGVLDV
jgi:ArsR family transcriptional regulator, arsenate/arsenite/antimonite-responsive transcriptional repressor